MAEQVERLQKFLAEAGVASRRKSEELIVQGKVKVNGRTAQLGDKVNPRRDLVTLSGQRISKQSELVYILMNKPRGYITTMQDEMDRKCVAHLIRGVKERVYPVGRLDRNSEGMLLLTNDGQFANLMTHPTRHVPKTYRVTIRPDITDEQVVALSEGMMLDGRRTAPAQVDVVSKEAGRVVLQMVLQEGRNRQIRRMCEALELEVARLKRIAIGTLKLGMLPTGQWRYLTTQEVRRLYSAASVTPPGGQDA